MNQIIRPNIGERNIFDRKMLFCIVTGLFWFSLSAYVPQMTSYAKQMGASYKLVGMIAGSYGLSQILFRLPFGITSDIFNRRKIFILVGLIITAVSALIVILIPNPFALLITRFLAGIAAATWVNFTVMFSSYFKPSQSTKAIGIINAANKAGQLAAMVIGGFISLYLGIKYIFILSVLGGIVGLILSLYIKEELKESSSKQFKFSVLPVIIKDIDIVHISFLGILSQLITYATSYGFTPIVASNMGANNFQLGILTIAFTLPQIIFAALSGTFFIKYLGEKNTLIMGFSINSVLCILTPFASGLWTLYLIQFLNGIGNALSFPLLMGLVIKNTKVELRNTVMGFYQAVYSLGMMAGPIILGSIGDKFGLGAGFLTTGILGTTAIVSIIIIGINNDNCNK